MRPSIVPYEKMGFLELFRRRAEFLEEKLKIEAVEELGGFPLLSLVTTDGKTFYLLSDVIHLLSYQHSLPLENTSVDFVRRRKRNCGLLRDKELFVVKDPESKRNPRSGDPPQRSTSTRQNEVFNLSVPYRDLLVCQDYVVTSEGEWKNALRDLSSKKYHAEVYLVEAESRSWVAEFLEKNVVAKGAAAAATTPAGTEVPEAVGGGGPEAATGKPLDVVKQTLDVWFSDHVNSEFKRILRDGNASLGSKPFIRKAAEYDALLGGVVMGLTRGEIVIPEKYSKKFLNDRELATFCPDKFFESLKEFVMSNTSLQRAKPYVQGTASEHCDDMLRELWLAGGRSLNQTNAEQALSSTRRALAFSFVVLATNNRTAIKPDLGVILFCPNFFLLSINFLQRQLLLNDTATATVKSYNRGLNLVANIFHNYIEKRLDLSSEEREFVVKVQQEMSKSNGFFSSSLRKRRREEQRKGHPPKREALFDDLPSALNKLWAHHRKRVLDLFVRESGVLKRKNVEKVVAHFLFSSLVHYGAGNRTEKYKLTWDLVSTVRRTTEERLEKIGMSRRGIQYAVSLAQYAQKIGKPWERHMVMLFYHCTSKITVKTSSRIHPHFTTVSLDFHIAAAILFLDWYAALPRKREQRGNYAFVVQFLSVVVASKCYGLEALELMVGKDRNPLEILQDVDGDRYWSQRGVFIQKEDLLTGVSHKRSGRNRPVIRERPLSDLTTQLLRRVLSTAGLPQKPTVRLVRRQVVTHLHLFLRSNHALPLFSCFPDERQDKVVRILENWMESVMEHRLEVNLKVYDNNYYEVQRVMMRCFLDCGLDINMTLVVAEKLGLGQGVSARQVALECRDFYEQDFRQVKIKEAYLGEETRDPRYHSFDTARVRSYIAKLGVKKSALDKASREEPEEGGESDEETEEGGSEESEEGESEEESEGESDEDACRETGEGGETIKGTAEATCCRTPLGPRIFRLGSRELTLYHAPFVNPPKGVSHLHYWYEGIGFSHLYVLDGTTVVEEWTTESEEYSKLPKRQTAKHLPFIDGPTFTVTDSTEEYVAHACFYDERPPKK